MPRFPFVKPTKKVSATPPIVQLALPAPSVCPTSKNLSRPRATMSDPTKMGEIIQFDKPLFRAPPIPGIDIRQPWVQASEPSRKQVIELPTKLTLEQLHTEYSEAHPHSPAGNIRDIMSWVYTRTKNAEQDKLLLEAEVKQLDERVTVLSAENDNLRKVIATLNTENHDLQVENNVLHGGRSGI